MNSTDRYECLSCGWRGEAKEIKFIKINFQPPPMNLEEKACPKCLSIALEKFNPRRQSKLL